MYKRQTWECENYELVQSDGKVRNEEVRAVSYTHLDVYKRQRHDCVKTDTLPAGGKGRPVNVTGMTWSGFRPSDDCCKFGYLIPANMMAVTALGYAEEISRDVYLSLIHI